MSPSARPLFAVMREDSVVERRLIERTGTPAALVVASGGCTAFDLVCACPGLDVVAFDRSPRQLDLVRAKMTALATADRLLVDEPSALLHDGAFEGLFRLLRRSLEEFVTGPEGLARYFAEPSVEERRAHVDAWAAHPYFEACFATTFHDALLHAMFGPAATQHATPGSYPGYFRRVFERGLRTPGGAQNRFLQHVLLGRYLPGDEPLYLRCVRARGPLSAETNRLTLCPGTLLEVPRLARFGVVSLSNIFDWSDDTLVAAWAERLGEELAPGAVVVVRKLNNQRDVRRFFDRAFRADEATAAALLEEDQSLFYEALEIFVRRPA